MKAQAVRLLLRLMEQQHDQCEAANYERCGGKSAGQVVNVWLKHFFLSS